MQEQILQNENMTHVSNITESEHLAAQANQSRNFLARPLILASIGLTTAAGIFGLGDRKAHADPLRGAASASVDNSQPNTVRIGRKKYRIAYRDIKNNFDDIVDPDYVNQCLIENTGAGKVNSPWSFPNGSIEQQRVKTSLGSRIVSIATKLRDVNLDNTTFGYHGGIISEFAYGCTYVSDSATTIQMVKKQGRGTKAVSEPKTFSFKEKPNVFHHDEFLSKNYKTNLLLTKPITKRDLSDKKYCIKVTQTSSPNTTPWDASYFPPNEMFRPLKPHYDRGIMMKDMQNPGAKNKSWIKCLSDFVQLTFESPKNSPWNHK